MPYLQERVGFFLALCTFASLITFIQAVPCDNLPPSRFNCEYTSTCQYGLSTTLSCTTLDTCEGNSTVIFDATCSYCFQHPESDYSCKEVDSCQYPLRKKYITTCTIHDSIPCAGNRSFQKYIDCNKSSGKSWNSTFWLSLLLGGFAADRFYLGDIGWGFFKLLSFGGCGLWVLIDFVLVATGYLQPYNGGLYVEDAPQGL
eukprot:TRINITY_DN3185_c0_g1_i2.p1 TRINITY_DN3185_c0_g1~~TRINITY_DN3185_c0_g1_i2.p1  ORF type:complete len:201 (-),score=25.77 TRINITY_DN3185_c0_g1_i2:283-885(-)